MASVPVGSLMPLFCLIKVNMFYRGAAVFLGALVLIGFYWQFRELNLRIVSLDENIVALNIRLNAKATLSCPPSVTSSLDNQLNIAGQGAMLVAGPVAKDKPFVNDAKQIANEARDKSDALERAAEIETVSLISGMSNRETTYAEWLALGKSISALDSDALSEAVTQKILDRVNRQVLKPPKSGNIWNALQGVEIEQH